MGVSAIPYSEMLAFFDLIGVTPDSSEIEVLEMFDRIAIKAFSEQQEKEQKRNQAKSSKKSSK